MNRATQNRRGIVFIIVAPSGAGKSSIVERLLANVDNLYFSVSYTSRKPRPGEIDGKDYHFISRDEFRKKIDRDEFLEWAEYVDNYYGTDRQRTEDLLVQGRDVVMDIDIQGADSIKEAMQECVRIFILPPDCAVLEERLRFRGTNTEEEINKRIRTAAREMKKAGEFDYLVVNDSLDDAVQKVTTIVKAERYRTSHSDILLDEILQSFQESL